MRQLVQVNKMQVQAKALTVMVTDWHPESSRPSSSLWIFTSLPRPQCHNALFGSLTTEQKLKFIFVGAPVLCQDLEQSPGRTQVTAGRAVLTENQCRLNISHKFLLSPQISTTAVRQLPDGLHKETLSPVCTVIAFKSSKLGSTF